MTKAKKTSSKAKKATNGSGKSKTAQVIALMKRPSGVTRAQVLELTGWKAVSMQQVAKAGRVRVKIDKSSFPFVYRCNGS
jgi:Protein of unknown function (DUF3489)